MFATRITFLIALAVLFVGQVTASPVPLPLRHNMEAREGPLNVIPAYIKRAPAANVEDAAMAPRANGGDPVPYSDVQKRAPIEIDPASVNRLTDTYQTKSENGNIKYKVDRAVRDEIAARAPNGGDPVPYYNVGKRRVDNKEH